MKNSRSATSRASRRLTTFLRSKKSLSLQRSNLPECRLRQDFSLRKSKIKFRFFLSREAAISNLTPQAGSKKTGCEQDVNKVSADTEVDRMKKKQGCFWIGTPTVLSKRIFSPASGSKAVSPSWRALLRRIASPPEPDFFAPHLATPRRFRVTFPASRPQRALFNAVNKSPWTRSVPNFGRDFLLL